MYRLTICSDNIVKYFFNFQNLGTNFFFFHFQMTFLLQYCSFFIFIALDIQAQWTMKLSFSFFFKKKSPSQLLQTWDGDFIFKKMGCNYSNYPPHFQCPSVPHFLSLKYGTRWPRKFDSPCRNIKYINLSHSGFSCFKAIFWRPSKHFWLTKKTCIDNQVISA